MSETTSHSVTRSDRLMTVAEIAERLAVSRSFARKLVRTRKLASVKVGDLPRVSERDLTKFLASVRREAVK
jgi:excisionase family DNA binding protein